MGAFSIDLLLCGAVAGLLGSIAFLFVARKKYQEAASRDWTVPSADAPSVIEPIKDLDGPQPVKAAASAEAPKVGMPGPAAKPAEKAGVTPAPVPSAVSTSGPKKLQPVTAAAPAKTPAMASDKTLVSPPPQAAGAAAAPAATPNPAPAPAVLKDSPGPSGPGAAADKTPSGLKSGDTTAGSISPAVVYLQNLKLQLEHLEKEVQTLKGQVSNVAQKHDTQFSAVLDRLADLKTELHSLPHEFPPMVAAVPAPAATGAPKAGEAPPPVLQAPPVIVPAPRPVEAPALKPAPAPRPNGEPAPVPSLPRAPKPVESAALPPAPKPFEMPLVEAPAPKLVVAALGDSPGAAPAPMLKPVEITQPIAPAPQPKPAPKPAEAPKAVPIEATIKLDLEAAIDAAIAVPPKGGAAAGLRPASAGPPRGTATEESESRQAAGLRPASAGPPRGTATEESESRQAAAKPAEAPKPVELPKAPEPALKDSPGPSDPGPAPTPAPAPKPASPTVNLDGPAGAGDSGERKPRRGPVWPV